MARDQRRLQRPFRHPKYFQMNTRSIGRLLYTASLSCVISATQSVEFRMKAMMARADYPVSPSGQPAREIKRVVFVPETKSAPGKWPARDARTKNHKILSRCATGAGWLNFQAARRRRHNARNKLVLHNKQHTVGIVSLLRRAGATVWSEPLCRF